MIILVCLSCHVPGPRPPSHGSATVCRRRACLQARPPRVADHHRRHPPVGIRGAIASHKELRYRGDVTEPWWSPRRETNPHAKPNSLHRRLTFAVPEALPRERWSTKRVPHRATPGTARYVTNEAARTSTCAPRVPVTRQVPGTGRTTPMRRGRSGRSHQSRRLSPSLPCLYPAALSQPPRPAPDGREVRLPILDEFGGRARLPLTYFGCAPPVRATESPIPT